MPNLHRSHSLAELGGPLAEAVALAAGTVGHLRRARAGVHVSGSRGDPRHSFRRTVPRSADAQLAKALNEKLETYGFIVDSRPVVMPHGFAEHELVKWHRLIEETGIQQE